MKKELVQKLNNLNKHFYKVHAQSFNSTRQEKWEGWDKLYPLLIQKDKDLNILDFGCGNGRFLKYLAGNGLKRFHYTGLDSSQKLINIAKKNLETMKQNADMKFITADVLDFLDIKKKLKGEKYNRVVVFGLIHHIPGFDNRIDLIRNLSSSIENNGQIYITFWQFDKSDRLTRLKFEQDKVKSILGKDFINLEKDDYLLDWDKSGLPRYCHNFTDDEINKVIIKLEALGLRLIESFSADGKEKNMNKYLIFQKT